MNGTESRGKLRRRIIELERILDRYRYAAYYAWLVHNHLSAPVADRIRWARNIDPGCRITNEKFAELDGAFVGGACGAKLNGASVGAR